MIIHDYFILFADSAESKREKSARIITIITICVRNHNLNVAMISLVVIVSGNADFYD
jgi:hypothetical protein